MGKPNKLLTPLEDVTDLHLMAQRYVKKDYFTWWYSDDSLSNILKPANGQWTAQSEIVHAMFYIKQEEAKKDNKRHDWTYVEDKFLKDNYMYLSDNVIGLALNIPGRIVKIRRMHLGLKKKVLKDDYKVIVWCERNAYEEDVKKYNLNGTLPDKQRP